MRAPEVTVLTPWRIVTRYVAAAGHRALAGREDQAGALLQRQRVAARLRSRPLFDEQELAAS